MSLNLLIAEVEESIGWVENEYGFVTDVLKKTSAKLTELRDLLELAQHYICDETPEVGDRLDVQDELVEKIRRELN